MRRIVRLRLEMLLRVASHAEQTAHAGATPILLGAIHGRESLIYEHLYEIRYRR